MVVVNISPVLVPRENRNSQSYRIPLPFYFVPMMEEIGYEFLEDIIWEKPNGSVPNRNGGFFQHRKPLAYKPNCVTEQIMVYRKETTKLIDWIYKQYPEEILQDSIIGDGYETSNVWNISPRSSKKHSAIFPIELCDKIINYYSFKGDLVYDPFAGSGSVGKSAIKNERSFFLNELNETYYRDAIDELQKDLFFEKIKTSI